MLFVRRARVEKPAMLRSELAKRAVSDLRAHFSLPVLRRHSRRAPLNSSIWNDVSVLRALESLFLGKCAICERTLIYPDGHKGGHVAHVRPRENALGNDDRPSIDHYGWLAYDWQNLIYLCSACIRKRDNLFPTRNRRASPLTSSAACNTSERPMLLNPCVDDPSKHLSFRSNGTCVALSDRGVATIEVYDLNSVDLTELRRQHFDSLLGKIEDALQSSTKKGYQILGDHVRGLLDVGAEFSGATLLFLNRPLKDLLRENPTLAAIPAMSADGIVRFLSSSSSPLLENFLASLTGPFQDELSAADDSAYYLRSLPRSRLLESQIQCVDIRNFKAIDHLTLELGNKNEKLHDLAPVAALLGENSVGKSSILQAIALTLMPDSSLRKVPRAQLCSFPRQLRTDLDWADAVAEVTVTFASQALRSMKIYPDGRIFRTGVADSVILAYGAHRLFDDESRQHSTYPPSQATQSWFFRERVMKHSAEWLRGLSADAFFPIARALRDVLLLRNDEEIERDEHHHVLIYRGGTAIPIEELSDGYRSLFAMTLDIMRVMVLDFGNLESATGFVLIDEIELHLHPSWKMKVVGSLRKAMPRVQFIFTTHDPLCLRGLYDGEAHVLVRDESGSVSALQGLPDVRLLRAEQLLTSDFFGLSSTSDPRLVGELDAYADSQTFESGFGTTSAVPTLPIGDTPADQIVNEALRRHVHETLTAHEHDLDRGKVREMAVEEVLALLRLRHGTARV